MTEPLILANLFTIAEWQDSITWQRFREGVEVHWLYQTGETGPAAALLRYVPGAKVPTHEHMGFEHILVLSGAQSDDQSRIAAGTLMIHPAGTRHRIVSEEGCIVLAIYEKRVAFTVPESLA